MLVISFDGVGDWEFEQMANDPVTYPNIARFKAQSLYRGDVKTIFVSNTYPIHASISTGKLPKEHGIISNLTGPKRARRWAQAAEAFRSETVWEAAAKRGLYTAAILWPTTCGAKQIWWNFPEVHTHGNEYQFVEHMRHGSVWFQIRALLVHGLKLWDATAVALDRFTTAITCDLLRKKRPDLTLLHLLAYDLISHKVGSKAKALDKARKSLDDSLGKLLDAAGERPVLVFADHAHLDVQEAVNLEKLFDTELFEQCGGCAFFEQPIEDIENYPWFRRFLTEREMDESGYKDKAAYGIAAKLGYCFAEKKQGSNHGYPTDYENYRVFYALGGKHVPPEWPTEPVFGDVRDITAVIGSELELNLQ